jgi:hypothetical protein
MLFLASVFCPFLFSFFFFFVNELNRRAVWSRMPQSRKKRKKEKERRNKKYMLKDRERYQYQQREP